MSSMNPSAIREMFKFNADISFSAGSPSQDTFPVEDMAELAEDIFRNDYVAAFQYGITEGYDPLRRLTRERMASKYSVGTEDDSVIITTGGQQGIDLAIKCLTNEGDTVVCENPSFIGALNDFRSYNTKIIGVPLQSDGMDLGYLEKVLKAGNSIKMVYTISTFQNPTGITMSFEKRKRLYELAVQHNFVILEDNPYFELRYSGEDIPNIKSLDKTGHVIFIGSYSKIISPGIRVGFAVVNKKISSKMTVAKQVQDIHTNSFFMILVAKYLEKYDIDTHIKKCCDVYVEKRDRMLSGLEMHMPDSVSFTRPDGGLYVWCEMPAGYSGTELCDYIGRRGVAVIPGYCLDVAEDRENPGFRLNFSVPSLRQIDRGIELIGDSVREYLASK